MNWHEMTTGQRDEAMMVYIREGEAAFLDGAYDVQCPYRYDKQEAIWWRRGFGNARLGEVLSRK